MAEFQNDCDLVAAALKGDVTACGKIGNKETTRWLHAVLMKRGASATEAADITADLMADCFGGKKGKPPLLEKYNGQGKLRAFLTRAAINRLIDLKRHQKFEGQLPTRNIDSPPADEFDLLAGEDSEEPEHDQLVGLIRDSLLYAFTQCDPLHLVLMRLVVVYGVRQELVGTLFGWSQSKVSRAISSVMTTIKEETMAEIKRADPWLELEWEDFLSLCRSSTGFLVGAPTENPRS
ncbi:MAG: sigma-70 family RNA polymerase sigma factor [Akkermansiaceae bacterium]|nr:sigma-70 family RNA polymerase sigma factor [Akkermansiaceae bacterium]